MKTIIAVFLANLYIRAPLGSLSEKFWMALSNAWEDMAGIKWSEYRNKTDIFK